MTDARRFSEAGPSNPTGIARAMSRAEWQSLPVSVRVADHLVEILVAANEIVAELQGDRTAQFQWVRTELDGVVEQIEANLQRLAS